LPTSGERLLLKVAAFFIFLSPFVGTILLVFAMKYFSALWQARARIAQDHAYRDLAEKAVAAQSDLSAIRSELSQVRSSLATIEKTLKQVE
jgi:5-bromo-4-chloroindolyl phosphate hydrolysis protein